MAMPSPSWAFEPWSQRPGRDPGSLPPGCALGKASLPGIVRMRRTSESNRQAVCAATIASPLPDFRECLPVAHPERTTRGAAFGLGVLSVALGIPPSLTPHLTSTLVSSLPACPPPRPDSCLLGTLPWPLS